MGLAGDARFAQRDRRRPRTIALRTRGAPACCCCSPGRSPGCQSQRRRRPDPRASRWARRARRLPAAGAPARPGSAAARGAAPRARRHQRRSHERRQQRRQTLAVTGGAGGQPLTRRAPSAIPSARTADHARPHLSASPARPASTRTRRRRRARLRTGPPNATVWPPAKLEPVHQTAQVAGCPSAMRSLGGSASGGGCANGNPLAQLVLGVQVVAVDV
jgi:hypothetical protein